MEGMKTSRERFYTLFNKIDRFETECPKQERKSKDLKEVATAKLNEYTQVFDKARTDFEAAMDDDFNTPAALAVMHEVVNVANKLIAEEQIDTCHKLPLLKSVKYSLKEVGRILGLFNIKTEEKEEDMETLAKVIEILIDLRNKARRDKDFKLADEIRDQLDKAGIIIEDEKEKTLWRKK
jgi:cysteinyl-tRNA synthetase